MRNNKVLFVYRKAHKGNFSIEKVYNTILHFLKKKKNSPLCYEKLTLRHTYDFFQFIKSFFKSLASKRHVVHITGGCNYMVMAFPFKTRVFTIHDFYHYQQFKGLKKYLYDTLFYKLPIYFSHYIITVSENTKKELMGLFNISEKKIKVIENPLLIPIENIIYRTRKFVENEAVQILQIGDKPLKNYQRLIEATKGLDVFYHFVHTKKETVNTLIKQHAIEEKTKVYSGLSNEELYKLYEETDVLFFASEAEGFGLPIIEAQAFGMPVITSNIPPMNQVGKGAILVDPFSVASIRNGFLKLFDPETINTVKNESKKNINRYNAEKVTEEYLKFYRQLI